MVCKVPEMATEEELIEEYIDRTLDWEAVHTWYASGRQLTESEIAERTGMHIADVQRVLHDIKMKLKAKGIDPRKLSPHHVL